MSTKKRGAISADCLEAYADATKNCLADLDDVTKYYKEDEPSGAGDCNTKDEDGCVPAFARDGGGRRLRRRLDDAAEPALAFPRGLGASPRASAPLVNEPGHYESAFTVALPFTNLAETDATVACSFVAEAVDYRGANMSGVLLADVQTVAVAGAANGTCGFTVPREAYRAHALTYLDPEGETDVAEHAYAVRITATVTSGATLVSTSLSKLICTPAIASATSGGSVCTGNRGRYLADETLEEEGGALHHLTSLDVLDCGGASGVNDGVCDSANNFDGCWDGGDCCAESCWMRNGNLYELCFGDDDDGRCQTTSGGSAFRWQHSCDLLASDACLDPAFVDYVAPVEYGHAASPVAFGGDGGADDDGSSVCEPLVDALVALGEPYATQLCGNASFARFALDCADAYKNATGASTLPRCAPRTASGCQCKSPWTNVDADGLETTHAGCANPFLGEGQGYHANDWCEIVDGSCDTEDLTPGDADYYFIDSGQYWWDDCGTGAADAETGEKVAVEELSWTALEAAATTLEPEAWVVMAATAAPSTAEAPAAPTPAPAASAGTASAGDDDDDDEGAFYASWLFWSGFGLGLLVASLAAGLLAFCLYPHDSKEKRGSATTVQMTENPFGARAA